MLDSSYLIKGGILLYFSIFALLFVFLVPPGEAPDEPAHVAYADFVAKNLELPYQYEAETRRPEGHQPPLYYMVCAAFNRILNSNNVIQMQLVQNPRQSYKDGRFQQDVPVYLHFLQPFSKLAIPMFTSEEDKINFYFLRLFSVVLGILNTWFILKLSELLFGDRRWRYFPALFVATLPQYIFMFAVINNDAMANFVSTVAVYLSFRIWFHPDESRNFLLLGMVLGLGLLTKKTVMVTLPPVLLVLAGVTLRRGSRVEKERVVMYSIYAFTIALAISGWYFVRNELLYGDVLASDMEKRFIMARDAPLLMWSSLVSFVTEAFASFVGEFGWNHVRLPESLYLTYAAVLIIGMTGFCIRLYMIGKNGIELILLAAFCLSAVVGFLYTNITFPHSHGRLLFPVISAFAVQLAVGFRQIFSFLHSSPLKALLGYGVVSAFVLSDLVSVFLIHGFYYRIEQYLEVFG